MNWSIIVDNSLCEHACNATGAAIAPLGTRLHDASAFTTALLHRCQPGGDIKLEIATAAAITSLHHDDDRLLERPALGQHSRGIGCMVSRYLNDAGTTLLSRIWGRVIKFHR